MALKFLASTLSAVMALTSCGGGGGGGSQINQTVAPALRIKVDPANLLYRAPDIGDTLDYSFTASVEETTDGEVTAEGRLDGTLSIQNYDVTFGSELDDAWSDFTVRAVEASFPDGTLEYKSFAYGAASADTIYVVDDEEGGVFH